MSKEEKKMSGALEGSYEVVLVKPGLFVFKGTQYDLCSMDLNTADKLHEAKCPYLKKAESKSVKEVKNSPSK
ncbi:hypothetical protein [Chondrinema litorale]|uniref:hypothetical protein n=1 Tax=Chondrinema litorale TaxID=2994555 RepID=UPI002543BE22|nr:hypothetical protein [Chondrinema litorale]UZR95942.1 hypothetical protein OQ292_08965 [Chondrinema litorale]